ncbi:MAG: hypothetical protein GH149_00285 [Methanosarcinales archaeon]|nr:hypothetical protein [Methanosarcinales archaeon]
MALVICGIPSIYDIATEGTNVQKSKDVSSQRICCVICCKAHLLDKKS